MKAEAARLQRRGSPKKVLLLILLFFLVLGGMTAGYLLVERHWGFHEAPPIHSETIQKQVVMNFDPFLIPLEGRSRYTLISLSFSLELPNGEVEKTMERRMNEIRAFIYEILREDFTRGKGIPSMQAVKEGVRRAVQVAFPDLQTKDVYISRFLAL